MTDPVIEFRDVSFAFGDRPILDGVSFAMEEGRTRVIMGASGAGKSTILKLILGLLTDAGEILVLGKDVTKMKPREMRETRHHRHGLPGWGAVRQPDHRREHRLLPARVAQPALGGGQY